MATGDAQPDGWSQPLRLDRCPECGYSLFGLRDAGLCPECGFAYSPDVVVLYGWQQIEGATMG